MVVAAPRELQPREVEEAPEVDDDDDDDDDTPLHNTHDLIQQILIGRKGKSGAAATAQGTFRSLHTHPLAEISSTPRSGDTPRKGGLSHR